MKDYIFFSLVFGFGVGVFIRSFFSVDTSFLLLLCVISISIFIFFLLREQVKVYVICIPLFLIACILGIIRFSETDVPPPLFLESQVGSKVSLEGLVVDDPDVRDTSTKISVEVTGDTNEKSIILVSTDPYSSVRYGDTVRIAGTLKKPKNFTTDEGKEFDYISYLWKDDIRYVISYGDIEVLSSSKGNLIKEKLFVFKHALIKKFSLLVPHPESGLLGGILLGSKEFLSADLRKEFIATGTIHIVALSGYNVSIVAEAIMLILMFVFSQIIAVIGGIFSIILFVLMTGASTTAIRAGIMGVLVLLARITGRPYAIFRALLLAGAIMILVNPRVLVFDVSFQLSFLATLGLIFLAPIIERGLKWIPVNFFREIVSATIAAQIAVLPFLMYTMGVLSIISLPINILILPFIPIAMFLGTATGLLAFIAHVLAVPFGYLTYGILNFVFKAVHVGSELPFASVSISSFPLWATLSCYAVIIIVVYKSQQSTKIEKI
jgi:competence protein ComEC